VSPAVRVGDLFERVPLPASATGDNSTLEASLLRFEGSRIQEAVAACGGSKTHAAKRLGVT